MAYLKRQNIGKFWPVARKGTKYLSVSTHNKKDSIPLVVVMREVLGIVRTKKELKKILNEKQIKINNKEIREANYPICLFDILSFSDKNYQAMLSDKKKMIFKEVSGKDAEIKVFKVLGKKLLEKGKVQVNLMNGKNILLKDDVRVGDSVVYNFKDKKVEKIIKMEKGNQGFVVKGKHAGHKGEIDNIIERGGKSLAKIVVDEGKKEGESKVGKINVWIKNIVVME